jgi:hypothetical protein
MSGAYSTTIKKVSAGWGLRKEYLQKTHKGDLPLIKPQIRRLRYGFIDGITVHYMSSIVGCAR